MNIFFNIFRLSISLKLYEDVILYVKKIPTKKTIVKLIPNEIKIPIAPNAMNNGSIKITHNLIRFWKNEYCAFLNPIKTPKLWRVITDEKAVDIINKRDKKIFSLIKDKAGDHKLIPMIKINAKIEDNIKTIVIQELIKSFFLLLFGK